MIGPLEEASVLSALLLPLEHAAVFADAAALQSHHGRIMKNISDPL